MSVINVKDAHKSYRASGYLPVLQGFNMTVERGSIYAMMGSSGSGKTTLLSCLVGINQLDSGAIELFGQPMKKIRKTRLGYMPQEIALISGFTVREMVYFFGTIAGLNKEKLRERFKFLSDLLELPDKDRLTRDCSGGQQRRISFAVALVHEPEILVLDEPTVGLDPLLREKIWDYLVHVSQKNNVTVLLTTHYIEEAGQATQIGLMRNGVQVAEDSPRNILETWETDNLEDAFLKMSERQEAGLPITTKKMEALEIAEPDSGETYKEMRRRKSSFNSLGKQSHKKIVKALLMKHFLEIVRHFGVFVMILIIPIIGCMNIHLGVGGKIQDIKIGVINNEVSSMTECLNKSMTTPRLQDFSCILYKSSCRYLDELQLKDSLMSLVYYNEYDDAYADLKVGNLQGIIKFAFNFTESMVIFSDEELLGTNENQNLLTDNGNIEIILDQSELQKTLQIKRSIYDAYESFMEGLMVGCERSKKSGNFPIVFEDFFGDSHGDYRVTVVSGMVVSQAFTLSSYLTSLSIITERTDGTWDRALVAGVRPYHFIISHLIEGMVIGFLQFLMYNIYLNFILTPVLTVNILIVVSAIMMIQITGGVTFGLLVSIVAPSLMGAFIVGQVFCYPIIFISGVIYPLEAANKILQTIGKFFPFAFPSAAMRSILTKHSGFSNYDTYMSFVVLTGWIIGSILLSFKFIKK